VEEAEGGSGKQVIARAAAVLRALAQAPTGLSIGQISKAADLPRTTVHRIVTALEAQGLAVSGAEGVRLGPSLVRLAASAQRDIAVIARPAIEALARRTRETVDLCVQQGAHAISIWQCPSDQELRVVCSVGTAFPIHATAHGKALLSLLTEEELGLVLSGEPERRTQQTVVDLQTLHKQLAKVRRDGIAVDLEEHAMGVCGVGAFLDTGLPDRHAISIAVPTVRFRERKDELCAALLQCKAEIESFAARY
jgi:IclR family acetate operon transcriptional repressor